MIDRLIEFSARNRFLVVLFVLAAAGAVTEPRQVRTGESAGDRVEILEGLAAGERIVTSGNFLIDSESQLNAATSGMKK